MPRSYLNYVSKQASDDPSAMLGAAVTREFYSAEAFLEGDVRKMQLQHGKTVAGSVRIFRAAHRQVTKCVVRRTWENIREDSKPFFLLWFPVAGRVVILQDNRSAIVDSGSFGISYSNRPFQIEALSDENERHESYQVAIPSYLTNAYLPHLDKAGGRLFPVESVEARFAKKMFLQLFAEGEHLAEKIALSYTNASLEALASVLESECDRHVEESSIKQVRLRAVLSHVDFHLCDPGLTATRVATECRISARYLHILFQEYGTSFHDYIWSHRLARAHEWLAKDHANRQSISHVAFTAGFRTISHFSRAFKAKYGYSPTDARTCGGIQVDTAIPVVPAFQRIDLAGLPA